MKLAITAALLSLTIGAGAALAQNPPAAAPAAPSATAPAAAPAAGDKKAISKSCSEQADAQGLHGKARHKFRSKCKHNGGKAS